MIVGRIKFRREDRLMLFIETSDPIARDFLEETSLSLGLEKVHGLDPELAAFVPSFDSDVLHRRNAEKVKGVVKCN